MMTEEQTFYAKQSKEWLGDAGLLFGLLSRSVAYGYVTLQIYDVTTCVYSWRAHGSTDIDITRGFFKIHANEFSLMNTTKKIPILVRMSQGIVANWRNGRGGGR